MPSLLVEQVAAESEEQILNTQTKHESQRFELLRREQEI